VDLGVVGGVGNDRKVAGLVEQAAGELRAPRST
jgi:hypothetical protein